MMSDLDEAADRLEAALDPDKRGGWTRLMDAGHGEPSEVEDLRTVIAGARETERLRTELAEAQANHRYEVGQKLKLADDLVAARAEIERRPEPAFRDALIADRNKAEDERNALAAELAEAQRQLDGVQREWAHRGTRLRTVANERDALAASVRELDEYVAVFRAAWREGREGDRVRSGLRAVSRAILDAAPEPESGGFCCSDCESGGGCCYADCPCHSEPESGE